MTMLKTSGVYRDHVFVKRESLITVFLQDKNFKAIHSLLVSVLFVLMICNFVNYFLDPSIFWDDFEHLMYLIPQVQIVVPIWVTLNLILICFVLPLTKCYVAFGFKGKPVYVTLMILTFIFLFTMPFVLVFYYNIYLLSCGVLLVEQVRLLMKMFSFVVENMKKQRHASSSPDDNGNEAKDGKDVESVEVIEPVTPTLKSFLYFLVAPTLIYRDEYPGCKRDLLRAAGLLLEVTVHIYAIAMMLKFTAAKFNKIGIEPLEYTVLMNGFFASCVCSLMFVIGMTYGLWHQYENMWSEVLAFGDRQFYGAWWTEKDLGRKVRLINMIVSDFLYEYIYRPARLWGINRVFASYAVVVVSGAFHEYIMWSSVGFFLPVLTLSMAAAIVATHIGDYFLKGNKHRAMIIDSFVFVFVNAFIAFGFLIEYYSRKNCPKPSDSLIDYIVPRMFQCVTFK